MKPFFKNAITGEWVVDTIVGLIPGNCCKQIIDSVLYIRLNSNLQILASGAATDFSDSNGDPYPDLDTLESATVSFFVKAPTANGGGVIPAVSTVFTTNGIDDGLGHVTGTQDFQLPSDVDLSYLVLGIDGSLINQGFIVNPTTKIAHYTVPPLAGTLFFIYFKNS